MRWMLGVVLSTALLTAQQGEYKFYGSPCLGSGFRCADSNPLGGDQPAGGNTNEFCIDVDASGDPLEILGFELWTRSSSGQTESLSVGLYLRGAGGKPATTPVATGTMQVGTTSAWCTAMFPQRVTVPRDTPYFLGFGGNDRVLHPLVRTGAQGRYHWRTDANASWTRAASRQRWAWKVLCASGEFTSPEIFCTDVPTIDETMHTQLRFAKTTTPAVLFTGQLKVNFSLTDLGARDCWLYVLPMLQTNTTTDLAGRASLAFPIPNEPRLVSASLYQQWAMIDLDANDFGVVFTAGGEAVIGQ